MLDGPAGVAEGWGWITARRGGNRIGQSYQWLTPSQLSATILGWRERCRQI